MKTPIALFVYSRPEHTRKLIESLLKNPEAKKSDLIVFSDAPKSLHDQNLVNKVRRYISQIQGFRSLTIHHRQRNYGLSKSIVEGVTQVLTKRDRVIVLEDDLITSSNFLYYMNKGLEYFAKDDRVISIHAYMFPVSTALPEAFFLRGADCWGWATWKRGWKLFNSNGQFLLNELSRKKLISYFNFNHSFDYYEMLKNQIKGKNDSWAIRWYASAFLANKLTLYPRKSLIQNIGLDGSGTHMEYTKRFDVKLTKKKESICLEGLSVKESIEARKAIEKFFLSNSSITKRVLSYLKFNKIFWYIRELCKQK